jgi:hypothetical protein
VEWGGHAVHYIYDSSLSWLDTITSVESSICLSGMRRSCSALYIWQLTILACYKHFRESSLCLRGMRWSCSALYIWQLTILAWYKHFKESSLCLRGMRWSCSALYIWQLTILAWYKNFSRKFQTYVLVEWGGHAVHYIYDSSQSWLETKTSVESSKPMS